MGYRLMAWVAAMALAASPAWATTMGTGTGSSATTAPGFTQSGTTAKSSVPASQAQVDKSARKAAKSAAKLAKKCAKWSRKAASARSEKKRTKFSARYNARCVAVAKTKTVASSAPTGSTIIDALSGDDAISSVIEATGVPGLTAAATGGSGSSGLNKNGTPPTPVAVLAVRFAPELVTAQVPEPGTLALLGLGFMGLCLSRRCSAAT